MKHDWPGNVRELRNALERIVLMGSGGLDPPAPLPAFSPSALTTADPDRSWEAFEARVDIDVSYKPAKQQFVDEFERRYLRLLLDRHDDNISAAARAAGIDRLAIYKAISRLGIERKHRRSR
jgi:DNA-binding NtrC family response regulator